MTRGASDVKDDAKQDKHGAKPELQDLETKKEEDVKGGALVRSFTPSLSVTYGSASAS